MPEKPIYTVGQRFDVIELLTASRKVFSGRCVVTSVTLAGDGANADCQVFDSPSATSNEKMHLEALSGTTSRWASRRGALFENGIYVTVNASTAHVTICYYPLEKKSLRER